MIITDIEQQVLSGNIHISPFNLKRTGVNSHDLTLSKHLAIYKRNYPSLGILDNTYIGNLINKAITAFNPYYGAILDSAKDNELERFIMPETGFVLQPNVLYLGAVNEQAGSDKFVPVLEGKSSTGRLGISVHLTAGVGDIGFQDFWTLEITAAVPVRVYPGMPICQVLFHDTNEIPDKLYSGNYENQGPLPVGSRMFKNFPLKSI